MDEKIKLFADKVSYGYGTSIPPLSTAEDENENENDVSSRKVIFCVHGKLSGCCTVVRGSTDDASTAEYQQNSTVPEDHCHRERNEEIDKKARKKLLLASALCVIFMIAEIVGNTTKLLMSTSVQKYFVEAIYEDKQ